MSVKGFPSETSGQFAADTVPPESPAGRGKRVRNPQGQGGRLRTDLIVAADRLLAQTGDVEGLALRAVAREAGVATPSIYLHFPGKQELVRAVLEVRFAELGARIRAAIAAADGPAAQLAAGCLAYCRFATDQPNAYRVLFGRLPGRDVAEAPSDAGRLTARTQQEDEGVNVDPIDSEGARGDASAARTRGERPEQPPRVGADVFAYLVEGVARCMQAGVAPSGDPHRVATGVWAALHGIVTLRVSVPGFPWPPLHQQVDDVLRGLVGLRHNRSTGAQ